VNAGRNVSKHQASLEKGNAGADLIAKQGRLTRCGHETSGSPKLPAGVLMTACVSRGSGATREVRSGDASQPATREGQAGPGRMADRSVVARKLGNASGAKGPQSGTTNKEGKAGDWHEPNNSRKCLEPSEVVSGESEGKSKLSVL